MAAAWALSLGTFVLLLLVIDSGVIMGLLRGGRLYGLRGARLKALPLLIAALMLQLLLGLPWLQVPGGRWGTGSVLLVVSLVLLLVVVRANRQIQTVVSVGDVLQYLGLFLLIQGLMVRNAGRRPKAAAPPGPWATLLRIAWLAILLGLLLQLALLLGAVRVGTGSQPRTAPGRDPQDRVVVAAGLCRRRPRPGGRQGSLPAGGRYRIASGAAGLDGRQHHPEGRR